MTRGMRVAPCPILFVLLLRKEWDTTNLHTGRINCHGGPLLKVAMRIRVSFFLLAFALASAASAAAQDRGNWMAASGNANKITGNISIRESKLTISLLTYPIALIRNLQPAEVAAVFDADANSAGNGALYRLKIPADQRFLNKNTLCGSEQTQWMATWVSGKTLSVAFFSGDDAPLMSFEALQKSTDLCGTYTFVR